MSVFVKILILFIIFILLNFVSIYTFDYKNYFDDKNKDIYIEEKSNFLDSIGINFLNKNEYKSSNFSINKKENLLYLNGIFSEDKVSQGLIDALKINKEGDLKYNKNYKIDIQNLEVLRDFIELQKSYLEDGSEIIVENSTITVRGNLINEKYRELFTIISNKSSNVNLELSEPSNQNIEDSNNQEENEDDSNKINYTLTLNDIQLLINNTLLSDKITFERRSSEPTLSSKIVIEKVAEILNSYSNYKVEVAGHTDSRGNKELNKKISQDRANRVKELLIDFGVDSNRITSIGYGNEKPIAKDDKDGLSEVNRRVEFNLGE